MIFSRASAPPPPKRARRSHTDAVFPAPPGSRRVGFSYSGAPFRATVDRYARDNKEPALQEGGLYSVDPIADAVDDGMQPASDAGVLRDPPIQGEGRGIE